MAARLSRMKHKQVLDHLASRSLVTALDEDLARWTGEQMLPPGRTHAEVQAGVIPPILARWRCLLDAPDTRPATKAVTWVALATLLHRYGFADSEVTVAALSAVDLLNDEVVLSDAFARQADKVEALLTSPPVPLTRRPRRPRPVTFLRPGDVVSVQFGDVFRAAYVREVQRGNEFPIVEFYAGDFDRVPELDELDGRAAARDRGRARYGVVGMTYLPDPARQIVSIASGHPHPPVGEEPRVGEGLWTLATLFRLPKYLRAP